MSVLQWIIVVGTAGYLLISAVRIALTVAILRRPEQADPPAEIAAEPVTVLQTVRSGDPLLAGMLRENIENNPQARFVWLADADDEEGSRVCAGLAAAARPQPPGSVTVTLTPPLPAGLNPKVFKLACAQDSCGELIAVLDDDTVLPPGALDRARRELSRGDLVTGVPVYRPGHGLYGRLVASFVNGSSLITYLPVLWFTRPVTINGMFYLTRRSVLESLGGFAAIEGRLCDDYEMAKLYRRGGKTIVQSAIIHPLSTTVPGLAAYIRLTRRWMFCAGQLFREELPLVAIAMVVLPAVAPLALVLTAAVGGQPALLGLVLAAMTVKAAAMAALRRRAVAQPASEPQPAAGPQQWTCAAANRDSAGPPLLRVAATVAAGARDVLLELLADLLVPLNTATALVRPGQVRWRDRVIDVRDGAVANQQTVASRR